MRKILHLPFPGKTIETGVRPIVAKPVRWHYDPDRAAPLLRLDTSKNQGGARRRTPL